jgi:hypothetical protein
VALRAPRRNRPGSIFAAARSHGGTNVEKGDGMGETKQSELTGLPASELAELIASRRVSATEAVKAHIDRIEALDGKLHADAATDPSHGACCVCHKHCGLEDLPVSCRLLAAKTDTPAMCSVTRGPS